MRTGAFFRLVIWELEEHWDFPVLEFVIFSAVFAVLNQPISAIDLESSYWNLKLAAGTIFIFHIFTAAAIFSRSFAGSLVTGEIKNLLSYPVHRTSVILSKFIANFSAIFLVYSVVFCLNIPLLALDPFEPMIYVSLLSLLLQLMLLCAATMALSLIITNGVVSVLASTLLFLGVDTIASGHKLLSFYSRHDILFRYFEQMSHGIMTEVAVQDVVLAVFFPIVVSSVLIALSLIYFIHVMEID